MLYEANLGRSFSAADFFVTLTRSHKINCANRTLSPAGEGGDGGGEGGAMLII